MADDNNSKWGETAMVEVEVESSRRHGILTIASGSEAGRILRIKTDDLTTLGRSPDCTHSFDDSSLSREHARVMRVGMEYVLRDDASKNGTFINGTKVSRATAIRNGDRVQLGSNTVLRFSMVDEQEETALRRVYEAAVLDGLTGIANRKHLEERVLSELAYAERSGDPLAMVLLDVDHFKKVNDTHGHLAGDAVLKQVASLFGEGLRAEDVVARYGGEEFAILLRGTNSAQALVLAERLRQRVEDASVQFDDKTIRVTSSGGVASTADPEVGFKREALFGIADARLYQAKQGGRNRIVGPG